MTEKKKPAKRPSAKKKAAPPSPIADGTADVASASTAGMPLAAGPAPEPSTASSNETHTNDPTSTSAAMMAAANETHTNDPTGTTAAMMAAANETHTSSPTGAAAVAPATASAPASATASAPARAATGAPAVASRTRVARVGLFVGREWSFPPAFLAAVERRDAGVVAEFAKIGAPRFDDPCPYDLCIDRISHEVPIYRSYLKHAALRGATVVNNPFMWTADDKFFGASLADRLGVASPRTVVLPNREYVPGIVPSESLRNLEYPLDWEAIVNYVGLPCVLKDAHGGGWKEVYVCDTLGELLHHYNNSGLLTMIVQEFIRWEHFVRCLVIGGEHVLAMKYDPKARRYVVDHQHLTPALGARIVRDARLLCRALGYDMNSMEFAIRDGVPYAIDFMNPAPDMDVNSLTPVYFEWAVEKMADLAVDLATAARDGRRPAREPAWGSLFGGAVLPSVGSGR